MTFVIGPFQTSKAMYGNNTGKFRLGGYQTAYMFCVQITSKSKSAGPDSFTKVWNEVNPRLLALCNSQSVNDKLAGVTGIGKNALDNNPMYLSY